VAICAFSLRSAPRWCPHRPRHRHGSARDEDDARGVAGASLEFSPRPQHHPSADEGIRDRV